MSHISEYVVFFAIYITIWGTHAIGITLLRKENPFALKLHKIFLNSQVKKFQYPLFRNLIKLWYAGKYLPATMTFVFLLIVPAAVFYFFCGILMIAPLVAIVQGFTTGMFIGSLDKENMLWALVVVVFEFGYWAFSSALGLFISMEALFNNKSFAESFSDGINLLLSGYWVPLVICMLGNAFIEIAGPIYWNKTGLVRLETLVQKQKGKENA